ncbi:MAG: hypothetical protein HQL32_03905 [Planctomycetes bacterium]|nr:hypothetical protein [Planctomycetota bacterium]
MINKTTLTILLSIVAIVHLAFGGIYPKDSKALARIHIDNLPKMVEQSKSHNFYAFWTSKEMEAFRTPIEKWYNEKVEELAKENKLKKTPELQDLFKGEILFMWDLLDFNVKEENLNFNAYLVFDCGSKDNPIAKALIEKVLSSMEEDKENPPRKDIRFRSHLFHTMILPQKESKDYDLEEDHRLQFGMIGQHLYVGMGAIGKQEATLSRIIPAIGKAKKSYPYTGLSMDVKLTQVWDLVNQALDKAQNEMKDQPAAPGPAMFMKSMNFKSAMASLGVMDIDSFSLNSRMEKNFDVTTTKLQLSHEARGLLKMVLPSDKVENLEIPDWVPGDLNTYTGQTIALSSWVEVITGFLQKELPMFAPMVMMQLNNMRDTMGVDIDKDLFAYFDDTAYTLELNTNKQSNNEMQNVNLNQVVAMGLKNGQKFHENLLKLLTMIPGAKMEGTEYMGGTIYPFVQNPSAPIQPTIAFTKNYLIYSHLPEQARTVMRLINKGPRQKLSATPAFASKLKMLPSHYHVLTFTNLNQLIKSFITMVRKVDSSTMGNKDDDEFDGPEIDFKLLPDPKDITHDFGSIFGYGLMEGKTLTGKYYQSR